MDLKKAIKTVEEKIEPYFEDVKNLEEAWKIIKLKLMREKDEKHS